MADRRCVHSRRMHEKTGRRARTGMPVTDRVGHRQDGLLSGQRLTQDG